METCLRCREPLEDGFDACWNCGADRDGRVDPQFRRADEPDLPLVPPSAGVAAVCPACGSPEFRTTPPAGWLAYAPDRLCTACGVRYTPPTPRWAALIFGGLGGVLVAASGVGLLLRVALGGVLGPAVTVGEVLVGVVGVVAIRHGVRALRHPGQV